MVCSFCSSSLSGKVPTLAPPTNDVADAVSDAGVDVDAAACVAVVSDDAPDACAGACACACVGAAPDADAFVVSVNVIIPTSIKSCIKIKKVALQI